MGDPVRWFPTRNKEEPLLKCQPYLHISLNTAIFTITKGIIDSPEPSSSHNNLKSVIHRGLSCKNTPAIFCFHCFHCFHKPLFYHLSFIKSQSIYPFPFLITVSSRRHPIIFMLHHEYGMRAEHHGGYSRERHDRDAGNHQDVSGRDRARPRLVEG